jgi:lanthanide-dependent methanol dehydrogenase
MRLAVFATAVFVCMLAGAQPAPPADDGQWVMPAKNHASTRFSSLGQINTANASQLKLAFSHSTGVVRGHEAATIVADNTMYIVTPYPNRLIALDLTKPGANVKWQFDPQPDPSSQGVACCDVVNRGAVYAVACSSTRSTVRRSQWMPRAAASSGAPSSGTSSWAKA